MGERQAGPMETRIKEIAGQANLVADLLHDESPVDPDQIEDMADSIGWLIEQLRAAMKDARRYAGLRDNWKVFASQGFNGHGRFDTLASAQIDALADLYSDPMLNREIVIPKFNSSGPQTL